jgi:hypothetical protein
LHAWLAEKQQILISVFCMTCLGSKPQSTTFEASTVTNTQLMQLIQLKLFKILALPWRQRFFFIKMKSLLFVENLTNIILQSLESIGPVVSEEIIITRES